MEKDKDMSSKIIYDITNEDGIIIGKLRWKPKESLLNPNNSYWSLQIDGRSKLNFSICEDAVKYAENQGYKIV